MKNLKKYLCLFLIVVLVLSACEVQEVTPPPVVTPTTAVETEPVNPEVTEVIPAVPTEELPLVDEDGNMSCLLVGPLFPVLTEEQEEQLAIFPEVTEDEWVKGADDPILTVIE